MDKKYFDFPHFFLFILKFEFVQWIFFQCECGGFF